MSDATETTAPAPWKGRLSLAALRLCAALPLPWALAVGRLLGRLMWRFAKRNRLFVECNLALCLPELSAPELSAPEREALGREAMENLGMTFAEAAAFWLWPKHKLDRIPVDVVGGELLERALAAGRGVLIALPHLGAWELINPYLIARAPFVAMYRPSRLPELDAVMRESRERLGARLVPAGPGGVKSLMKHLNAGGLSIILPDQEPELSGGVFAPFFGMQALTATLYSRLLHKTGATPLLAFVERRCVSGTYRIHFRAAPEAIGDPDPLVAASAVNRGEE